jgi:hypothetical protein
MPKNTPAVYPHPELLKATILFVPIAQWFIPAKVNWRDFVASKLEVVVCHSRKFWRELQAEYTSAWLTIIAYNPLLLSLRL